MCVSVCVCFFVRKCARVCARTYVKLFVSKYTGHTVVRRFIVIVNLYEMVDEWMSFEL